MEGWHDFFVAVAGAAATGVDGGVLVLFGGGVAILLLSMLDAWVPLIEILR